MLRNPLVLALIFLGGFIWLLRSPYGDQVRSFVMAEPNVAVVTAVATPAPAATAMATAAPESTPTATALPPTATRTLQPTMTPSPTTYVVKVKAIELSVKAESRLITYEQIMAVSVIYSDSDKNKSPVWNNGDLFVMEAIYTVGATVDMELMNVTVSNDNKITVTLPAPRLEAPSVDAKLTRYEYKPDGVKYWIVESNKAKYMAQAQIDGQAKASKQACETGLLDKAAKEAQYRIKDLVLNIDPRINTRDVTVVITPGSCTK
jgi:hypothetical protein